MTKTIKMVVRIDEHNKIEYTRNFKIVSVKEWDDLNKQYEHIYEQRVYYKRDEQYNYDYFCCVNENGEEEYIAIEII